MQPNLALVYVFVSVVVYFVTAACLLLLCLFLFSVLIQEIGCEECLRNDLTYFGSLSGRT